MLHVEGEIGSQVWIHAGLSKKNRDWKNRVEWITWVKAKRCWNQPSSLRGENPMPGKEKHAHTITCTPMYLVELLTAKKWEQYKVPSTDKWISG